MPLLLPSKIINMDNHNVEHKEKEFGYNWVNSSRFLFYLQVLVFVAFVVGGCYNLYEHRYKGKPDVEVPGNAEYTPKYK